MTVKRRLLIVLSRSWMYDSCIHTYISGRVQFVQWYPCSDHTSVATRTRRWTRQPQRHGGKHLVGGWLPSTFSFSVLTISSCDSTNEF